MTEVPYGTGFYEFGPGPLRPMLFLYIWPPGYLYFAVAPARQPNGDGVDCTLILTLVSAVLAARG